MPHPPPRAARIGLLARQLGGHPVRGVLVVGRHLHRELAARAQGAAQAGHQRRVVGQPVQGRVGEHQIVLAVGGEGRDVGQLEAQPGAGEGARAGQHLRRAVDADGVGGAQGAVQLGGELAAAAAEVDDAPTRRSGQTFSTSEEVKERPASLVLEALVRRGIPSIGHRRSLDRCRPPRSTRPRRGSAVPRRRAARRAGIRRSATRARA